MRRIKITSKGQPRVRNTAPGQPPVAQEIVAAALGAQPIAATSPGLPPPSFIALRTEIARRLTSTGGRPALVDATRRQKIPISDADWARLLDLAECLAKEGVHSTPGQVASALLHNTLTQIK